MNKSLTTATRSDFSEYWRYLDKENGKPESDIKSIINVLDKYALLSNSGYSITNKPEVRFDRVNYDALKPASKLSSESFIKRGYEYTFYQMPEREMEFNFSIYMKLVDKEIKRYHIEKRTQFEAFLDMHYRLNPFESYYYRVLQHLRVLKSDKDNFPILFYNQIHDITHLKKPENPTLAIKTAEGHMNFFHFDVSSKKTIDFKCFSERELSILELLKKGLSSKQIADILFISPNTVDTHRRNMLQITNCVNTTALIVYCRILGM